MTHNVTVIAQPGLQHYLSKELRERFGHDPSPVSSLPAVTVTLTTNELLKVAYLAQMPQRITLTLENSSFNNTQDITLTDQEALNHLRNSSYRVSCDRVGDHDFTSVDVEKRVGGQLTDHGHTNIDLTTPDNTVYVYVKDNAYHIGLDIAGRDLSKRQYKVFSSNNGINATLGYAFIQHCDISDDSRVVNPFSRDGVIPIETALDHKGVSVNHYDRDFKLDSLNILDFFTIDDKLDEIDGALSQSNTEIHCYDRDFRNLKAQKKNAKIAGVEDHMTFSRFEPEYIDLKFDDFQVDLIYGRPKTPSRQFPEDKLRNVYHDLFRYGKYVLKQSGKMIFLVKDDELLLDMANQFTLKETNRTTIRYRHLEYDAITLEREHPDALEATHL